jgi:WD40 repeat protein
MGGYFCKKRKLEKAKVIEEITENEEEEKIIYGVVNEVKPISKYYSIKTLIKIGEEKFVGFSTDNMIGIYNFDEKGIKYKTIESPIFLNYVMKLSDNRFLNCSSTKMDIFSIDLEEERIKIEQEIELSSDDPGLMCIELSNGNLISTGIYKGSLSIWTKNKDNQYTLLKKENNILGCNGSCLFGISNEEIVAASSTYELLFINSDNLKVNETIPDIITDDIDRNEFCRICEDILAVGGGYGYGIYLISISKKNLIKQIKTYNDKIIHCIYKLKNGLILTSGYINRGFNGQITDLEVWEFDEKNISLKKMSTIEEVEYAPISSIIELDNKKDYTCDFITGSLSGIIKVWKEKIKLAIL